MFQNFTSQSYSPLINAQENNFMLERTNITQFNVLFIQLNKDTITMNNSEVSYGNATGDRVLLSLFLHSDEAYLRIYNSNFHDLITQDQQAVMYASNQALLINYWRGDIIMKNTMFTNNWSKQGVGAVITRNINGTYENVLFKNNTTPEGSYGAAFFHCDHTMPKKCVSNCSHVAFIGNSARDNGGAYGFDWYPPVFDTASTYGIFSNKATYGDDVASYAGSMVFSDIVLKSAAVAEAEAPPPTALWEKVQMLIIDTMENVTAKNQAMFLKDYYMVNEIEYHGYWLDGHLFTDYALYYELMMNNTVREFVYWTLEV